MRYLNSVLIEGKVIANPSIEGFVIDCDGMMVPIHTKGRQAEVCMEFLKKGRGVRIVGHLVSGGAVSAEHVEIHPQGQERKEKEDESRDS
jgi:hypothetical protein